MRSHSRFPCAVPQPAAVITRLCSGPSTLAQLAREFQCRPTCLRAVLVQLKRAHLVAEHAKPDKWGRFPSGSSWELAIDPAAAFAMLRARVEVRKHDEEKQLHGSLEYLHNEAVRLGGDSIRSECEPPGPPADGPLPTRE